MNRASEGAAMSNGAEIVGDVAQGALIARAVEPGHGEGGDGHTAETACLNCGTRLIGSHCHACGQTAHVHRTLRSFFHDLVHGVFHFEGKIWRTLPLLAWRPGRLTREYIDGRRASYVSPIALFLFVVFLTFALFNSVSNPIEFDLRNPEKAAAAQAEADRNMPPPQAKKTETTAGENPQKLEASFEVSPAEMADNPLLRAFNEARRKAQENPDLLIYKLQSNAYKFSWLLIPISIPFVWLLFPFSRRFHVYDHTVFVTYSLSFLLLLLSAISLAMIWGAADWVIGFPFFYAPFHMYRQLREAYDLTRFAAWWRTWFLALFALLALTLFAIALTLLAVGG
jgi:Protein of unknown function (DUF3667)